MGSEDDSRGGYYSLPERRSGNGVLIVGDAAGFVDVPSLKGIHYAMQSGIYAARAAFAALKSGDTSAAALSAYDRTVDGSFIVRGSLPHPQHEAGLQGRVLPGRGQGGIDDPDRRQAAWRSDRYAGGRRGSRASRRAAEPPSRRLSPTTFSPSARSTQSSNRETRRAIRSPHTFWWVPTSARRWLTSTPTYVPLVSTSGRETSSASTRRTA